MSKLNKAKQIIKIISWCLCVLICTLTLASAYGGYVNPNKMVSFALLAMAFPLFLILLFIATMVFGVAKRDLLADICALTMVACLPALSNYSPGNFSYPKPTPGAPTLKVMNFNAIEYNMDPQVKDILAPNPSVQCIIDAGADIVCLQECVLAEYFKGKYGITQAQINELARMYPYRNTTIEMSVYSRYPILKIRRIPQPYHSTIVMLYEIDYPGQPLSVFSVHLASLRLDRHDREVYAKLTEGGVGRKSLTDARSGLLSKFAQASRGRAEQTEELISVADSIGGNIIFCGDFNDIPSCYADHLFRRAGYTDAYAEAGCGPGISFRKDHFFFRIDHVFSRGNLRPVSCRVLKEGLSDHYPVLTTFEVITD